MLSRCLLLIALAAFLATATVRIVEDGEDYQALFQSFKAKYGRHYASSEVESKKFHTFVENMKEAKRRNAENPLAHFGVNGYSDYTAEEFKAYHSLKRDPAVVKRRAAMTPASTRRLDANTTNVDWRNHGAVTPIKNQGQCGSCWAFSTTGVIEGSWALAGHPLTSLSEQELVSCDTNDDGCNGGDPREAMDWLVKKRQGEIATEASDPYKSESGNSPPCRTYGTTGAVITGHDAIEQNEHTMQSWCAANGPVSICIDATSFQTYERGIMTKCIGQQVDHCVLIVGFNAENNPPYWIIKNSWGTSWGMDGYIYLEMFKDECLITSEPSGAISKPSN